MKVKPTLPNSFNSSRISKSIKNKNYQTTNTKSKLMSKNKNCDINPKKQKKQKNKEIEEASPYRNNRFIELEEKIEKLKSNYLESNQVDKSNIKSISSLLQEITGIKNLSFGFDDEAMLAFCIYVFDKDKIKSKIKKNNLPVEENKYDLNDLDQLNLEPDDIDKAVIYIGSFALEKFTTKEIVAILLHEIGHFMVYSPIEKVKKLVSVTIPLLSLSFIVLLINVFASTGKSSTSYRSEYDADSYAVKYGYGDELINALKKIENTKIKNLGIFYRIGNVINKFFKHREYPNNIDRIHLLKKTILKNYKELYPNVSQKDLERMVMLEK